MIAWRIIQHKINAALGILEESAYNNYSHPTGFF